MFVEVCDELRLFCICRGIIVIIAKIDIYIAFKGCVTRGNFVEIKKYFALIASFSEVYRKYSFAIVTHLDTFGARVEDKSLRIRIGGKLCDYVIAFVARHICAGYATACSLTKIQAKLFEDDCGGG